jgi:hypothetical protein
LSNFRLSQPAKGLGPAFWLFVALCLFGVFYAASRPSGEVARQIAAAGPGGVTAYFSSPQAAVMRINQLLVAHDWVRLAHYYDFTLSSVLPGQATSGEYFIGHLAVPPEGAIERPFPAGYHFVDSQPTELPLIFRIVVAGVPPKSSDPASAPQASFFLRASPDGYRIIPADAAGRLNAAASKRSNAP